MEIIPIAVTQPNWPLFIKAVEKTLGYSPTRSLDIAQISIHSAEGFLSALDAFKNQDNDPRKIKDFALKHVTISFLIVLDTFQYMELLEYTYSNIIFLRSEEFKSKSEAITITTGSLFNWVKICTELNSTYSLKEFAYKIYETLRKIGFNNIFSDYSVTENLDGSKYLERRR